MYILHISDFHFGAKVSQENEERIFEEMAKKINKTIPAGELLIICACGDFIDSKDNPAADGDEVHKRYELCSNAFQKLEESLPNIDIKWGMCPGNHDITHPQNFEGFLKKYNLQSNINEPYVLSIKSENTDIIFANSCYKNNYVRGGIDYNSLEDTLRNLSEDTHKILCIHHAFISMDASDDAAILNAPYLIKLIDEYNISVVLHGHTHSQYNIGVQGVDCTFIGVGAMISRDHADVNSQFNLIQYLHGVIGSAGNFSFHADIANMPGNIGFQRTAIRTISESNFFVGKRISKVYKNVLNHVKAKGVLYGLHICIKSDFDAFKNDVYTNFNHSELTHGEKIYSYPELAELWESSQLDDKILYFNHGEYFNHQFNNENENGLQYLTRELKRKPTSSRALVTTINMKNISEEPDSFLPSMCYVQVSLDKKTNVLHIAMNLRALEASRFLKINICEILYIAEQLKSNGIRFGNVEIDIFAFRTQIKNDFGCFFTAQIDLKDASDFAIDLKDKEYFKIANLLKEKADKTETKIVTIGIENLLIASEKVLAKLIKTGEKTPLVSKLEEITPILEDLIQHLNRLEVIHSQGSVETTVHKDSEDQVRQLYNKLIEVFERKEG